MNEKPIKRADISDIKISDVICPCSNIPKSLYKKLFFALMLNAGQQFTGVNAILFFTEAICKKAGFEKPAICAVYIAMMQAVFAFFALFIIDRFPRKFLLQLGAFFTALGQLSFGLANSKEAPGYVLLLSVAIFFMGYATAWGPLPLLVSMEMFPVSLRGPVSAAGLAISWLVAYLITQYFLSMCTNFGVPNTFYAYAVLCLLCGVFVRKYIPETNTLTRELESTLIM